MNNLIQFFCLLIVICGFTVTDKTHAKTSANTQPSERQLSSTKFSQESLLSEHFKSVVDQLNQELTGNHVEFKTNPNKLVEFVDNSLLKLWSGEKTLKGLLGKSIWRQLSEKQYHALIQSFNNTIQRYVQESIAQYDGQLIVFQSLKLNKSMTRGLLKIEVQPNLLPSFNLDFKLAKIDDNWLLYDALFQGVGYIDLKKDSFRSLAVESSIDTLIDTINQKNKGFLKSTIVPTKTLVAQGNL